MKRTCFAWLLLSVTACSPAGNALKVTLETTAGRAETCFVVEARDGAGELRGQTRFPRHDDRTTYLVGIVRDTLPAEVKLSARALIGADCETATRANGSSESLDVTFDPKRILEVTLHLSGGDDDGDGFVATAHGGEDCNDGDPAISPGAAEHCFGAVDHDCNGLVACADPVCAGQPCAGLPAKLALSGVPPAVRLGACSGLIAVAVEDAQGRLAQAPAGARLTPGGPFTFFSDGACGTPVTDLPLAATTSFALVAAQIGTARLTVDSPMLTGDLRDLQVDPALPAGLQFTTAPVTARAGQCSPPLSVGLVDVNGLPTPADAPLSVSLGADAGGVFGLYSDGACGQPLSSLDFAAGTTVGTFHFSGQRAGLFGLRAEATGLTGIDQRETITPGPVATVVLLAATPTLTGFTCSDAFTVDARDAFGNPVMPAALAVEVPDAGATVFTAPGCATSGVSMQFALIASEEGSFTVQVTADGVSASQPITVRRPGPAGSTWRWPLTVTTGGRAPAGGYQGYTLQAAFDSRDAVDAGQLSPGAGELRVQFWSDAGWREVDRLIESPNSANTTVRFASQTDLPASATDLRYSLFAGPFDGGTAAANLHAVYLFADDFEEGTLARWTLRSGAWQRATDRVHGGVGSLKFAAEGNNDRLIEASPALSESDVLVEAWWNTSNVGTADFSQLVRLQPGVVTAYETNLETTGWDIAWDNAGAWTELVANRGPATVDTWVRIGLSISGRDARVWQNRVQLVPQTGAYQVALPGLGAGNVGFRKHNLAGSMWIDDVTVRRYTEPEPALSVGAAQRVP